MSEPLKPSPEASDKAKAVAFRALYGDDPQLVSAGNGEEGLSARDFQRWRAMEAALTAAYAVDCRAPAPSGLREALAGELDWLEREANAGVVDSSALRAMIKHLRTVLAAPPGAPASLAADYADACRVIAGLEQNVRELRVVLAAAPVPSRAPLSEEQWTQIYERINDCQHVVEGEVICLACIKDALAAHLPSGAPPTYRVVYDSLGQPWLWRATPMEDADGRVWETVGKEPIEVHGAPSPLRGAAPSEAMKRAFTEGYAAAMKLRDAVDDGREAGAAPSAARDPEQP